MKRNFLLVLMALAFAINAPELSYSQTNLEVELLIYGAALYKSSRDLSELMKDLTKITKKATHGEGKSKLQAQEYMNNWVNVIFYYINFLFP